MIFARALVHTTLATLISVTAADIDPSRGIANSSQKKINPLEYIQYIPQKWRENVFQLMEPAELHDTVEEEEAADV